ncbi:MAG: DmsE family decaheme c-type cytochrome [Pseudomonadota bacterium]
MLNSYTRNLCGWLAGLLAALNGAIASDVLPPADAATSRCLVCHETQHPAAVNGLRQSRHAGLVTAPAPFAASGCTGCHGDSEAHMRPPATGQLRAAADETFRSNSLAEISRRNDRCLACHQSESARHWSGSRHDLGNVACNDCHRIHAATDPVMARESENAVCFSCHQQQRTDSLKPYTHPLQQGEMTCSACHNPHGSFNTASLHGSQPTETCYRCHAEKRGPFLWEHPPVREDCAVCHQAHGSVHVGMLKQRGPWLCQQCHLSQYHPSTAYSGTGLPPTPSSSVVGKNCLNCHAQIHGSNHPSGIRQIR